MGPRLSLQPPALTLAIPLWPAAWVPRHLPPWMAWLGGQCEAMRKTREQMGEARGRGWQLYWLMPCPLCGFRSVIPGKWGGLAQVPRFSLLASWNGRAQRDWGGDRPAQGWRSVCPCVRQNGPPKASPLEPQGPVNMKSSFHGKMYFSDVVEVTVLREGGLSLIVCVNTSNHRSP